MLHVSPFDKSGHGFKSLIRTYIIASAFLFLSAGGCNQGEIRDDFFRVFSLPGTRLAAEIHQYIRL